MRQVALAVLLLLVGAAGAHADDGAAEVPCWFDIPDGGAAVCYRVEVPVRHGEEGQGVMSLPVAVLKSEAGDPAPDPVVMVQGGPGASFFYTDYPDGDVQTWWWEIAAPVLQNRDVVIYDQRGTGFALPSLNCAEVDEVARSATVPPGIEVPFFDRGRPEVRACYDRLVGEGVDPSVFSTPANADDLAFLIRALGYERANLWAMSYGTRVALETLRRHPGLVRAAVLDGVYPPHIRADENAPWATWRAFNRIFDDCAKDDWCRETYGDVGTRFQKLLDAMNAEPKVIALDGSDDRWPAGAKVKLDGDLVVFHMYDALYYGEAIPYVPSMVVRAVDGDLDSLGWFYWYPFFADWALDEGVFLSITCREERPRIRYDVMAEEAKDYGAFGRAGLIIATDDICGEWPVPPAAEEEWQPVESDVPVLLLSGAYDPVTPPEWAADTATHLANSRHFEFLGAGHVPSASDMCAARYVADFFDDPDPAALAPPDCELYTNPADFSAAAD